MSDTTLTALWRVTSSLQAAAMTFVALLMLFLGVSLTLVLAGVIPGLNMTLTLSDGTAFTAGTLVHASAFLTSLLLLSYMPANWRMRRLEAGHRSFRIGMKDVARAYHVAHTADRDGTFSLSSEYDAVRERLGFLADHPDLGQLEPEILEVAAQMSRVSEDLAATYSTETVNRAKAFLAQRQEEVKRMEKRIEDALDVSRELKHWHDRVSLDEDVARSRVARLKTELDALLNEIGVEPAPRPETSAVVSLPSPRTVAAE